jgi:hypothetical protein
MDRKAQSDLHQRRSRIKRRSPSSAAVEFFSVLTSEKLLQTTEALLPKHRERLYPPKVTLSMPDTPENQAVSPKPSTQTAGVGSPLARLVRVIRLATGSALDAAIRPYLGKGGDELGPVRQVLGSLRLGDVMLADALYCNYLLIATQMAADVDVLFEQNGSRIFPRHQQRFQDLVSQGQHPKTLFIGCSDSRLVPYLLTGTAPGELFLVRNVGAFVPRYDGAIERPPVGARGALPPEEGQPWGGPAAGWPARHHGGN